MDTTLSIAFWLLVGVIVGLGIAGWCAWFLVKRYRKNQAEQVAKFLQIVGDAAKQATGQAGVN